MSITATEKAAIEQALQAAISQVSALPVDVTDVAALQDQLASMTA